MIGILKYDKKDIHIKTERLLLRPLQVVWTQTIYLNGSVTRGFHDIWFIIHILSWNRFEVDWIMYSGMLRVL